MQADILSAEEIKKYLTKERKNNIAVFDTVDSTNTILKNWCAEGKARPGDCVTADCQTKGRGRRGKRFESDKGVGIYLSFLLGTGDATPDEISEITAWGAVAVRRAIEKVCHAGSKIKWVNDIVCGRMKICGILTEMTSAGPVMGIGINVKQSEDGFPPELRNIASSLRIICKREFCRAQIIAAVIEELDLINAGFPEKREEYLKEYRENCAVIGEEINERKTTAKDISDGFSRIILGLGKKVIIANNLSTVVTALFGSASNGYENIKTLSVAGTWLGAVLVGLWYYFDFSGYSDIAIGLGRIFGFHFDENFKYPFICKTISEFWQRWHISLSSFFRDYVLYLPIFGKRRKYGGLFLVWFCTGLWHGASWNFVFWGLYYGMFIFFEMLIGKKRMKKMPVPLAHIYTKLVIFIGFGIFYFENLGSLGTFFKALVGANGNKLTDTVIQHLFMNNIWLFAAAVLFTMPVIPKIKEKALSAKGTAYFMQSAGVLCNAAILVLSSVLLVNTTNNPFLYFRF